MTVAEVKDQIECLIIQNAIDKSDRQAQIAAWKESAPKDSSGAIDFSAISSDSKQEIAAIIEAEKSIQMIFESTLVALRDQLSQLE